MAWALVQAPAGVSSSGLTVAHSFVGAPTVGNLCCAIVLWWAGATSATSISSLQDGNSNAYAKTTNSPSVYLTDAGMMWVYYWVATGTPSATVTATFADSATFSAMWLAEFSAGAVPTFDTDAIATTSSNIDCTTPSVTPAAAGSLMIGVAATSSSVASTNSPWTALDTGTTGGSNPIYDLSVTGAQAYSQTAAGSANWTSVLAAFREGAAGPAPRIITPTASIAMMR